MTGEPVAAFHVLNRPCEQQLAKTQSGDEHERLVDFPAF
jgi:hypothetical protein